MDSRSYTAAAPAPDLLRDHTSTRLSKGEIEALVAPLQDIADTLTRADPADKAGIYEEMGIEVTYHQDGQY